MIKEVGIRKYISQKKSETVDWVAEERPLTIVLNDVEIVTLLCSPSHLDELAVGYVLGEGLMHKGEELEVNLDEKRGIASISTAAANLVNLQAWGKRYVTSGCGKGTSFFQLNDVRQHDSVSILMKVKVEEIFSAMNILQRKSQVFLKTGGVHSAALQIPGSFIFREDVGRHNAVDKLFGYYVLNKLDSREKILYLSGRISSEIIGKARRMGVPVIVSRSAPTSLAIQLAEEVGITLVGFTRGNKANVYTHYTRIE
ncbi:formate dehydrogenase accessory sulfurtransferase FdhD [Thermanaerosceptrum fracticalcis]|uniref:Sulfur carrier protein FdhD n=1 Tax=Thermanaerosceptrum fracticalcis TaxID=1712410 RepID=A0A7G6E3J4_THEFR|nr:formate dehydrogenase accessory sulfurtransferase FdhD [Thermanaerosceptrum fracticalcis]QNB46648.1 formate dehydrogenase accessory sulfurtransferase FdhD [Thermanaerosceptrum fracticalcis]